MAIEMTSASPEAALRPLDLQLQSSERGESPSGEGACQTDDGGGAHPQARGGSFTLTSQKSAIDFTAARNASRSTALVTKQLAWSW